MKDKVDLEEFDLELECHSADDLFIETPVIKDEDRVMHPENISELSLDKIMDLM